MEGVTEAEKNNAGCAVWRNRRGEMTDTRKNTHHHTKTNSSKKLYI